MNICLNRQTLCCLHRLHAHYSYTTKYGQIALRVEFANSDLPVATLILLGRASVLILYVKPIAHSEHQLSVLIGYNSPLRTEISKSRERDTLHSLSEGQFLICVVHLSTSNPYNLQVISISSFRNKFFFYILSCSRLYIFLFFVFILSTEG